MSKLRFRVVETAFKKKAVEVATPAERPSEYFAKYVFNKEKMFKYLPSKVYNALIDAIDNGAPLDRSIADEVAAGMKKWAIDVYCQNTILYKVCLEKETVWTTVRWKTSSED